MKNYNLRRKSLDEMIDEHIGVEGTKDRDSFEVELRLIHDYYFFQMTFSSDIIYYR